VKPTEGAQSIRRAAQILRIVASFSGRGASLGEVVAASRLQKATVHRMLRALCHEGLIEQDGLSRNYRVGIGIFALGAAMGERFDIRSIADASMEAVRSETEDTVYLAIRSGYDGLCLGLLEGTYPEKTLKLSVHDRWPLGVGAFSMPLLAFLPDEEVREIVEHNAARLAGQDLYTPEKLLQRVKETRAKNYAVNQIVSYPTMCGVGVPVLDAHRRPIASLCVTAIISRMPPERQKRVAALLWTESMKISEIWQGLRSVAAQADSWRAIAPSRPREAQARQANT
jgi:DNA-binding IclR family transcriptional regulator